MRSLRINKNNVLEFFLFPALVYFFISSSLQSLSTVHNIGNKLSILLVGLTYLWLYGRIKYHPIFNCYLLFIISSAIGTYFIAVDRQTSLSALQTIANIYVMSVLVYNIFYRFDNFAMLSYTIIAVTLFLTFGHHFVYGSYDIIYGQGMRFQGLTGNPNMLGTMLMMLVLASFYLIDSYEKLLIKTAFIALIFIAFYILASTGSRKFALYTLILTVFILFVKFRNVKSTIFLIVVSSVVLIYFYDHILAFYQGSILATRFESHLFDRAGSSRINLQLDALMVFIENPFLGVGIDNYRIINSYGLPAHGYAAEVLANNGAIGFILLLTMYVTFGKKAITSFKKEPDNNECLFALCVLIIFFLTSFGFHYYNGILHWFLFSAVLAYLTKKEKKNNEIKKNPCSV